jgi:RNA polymerase sigma factor (sigma-70 family)
MQPVDEISQLPYEQLMGRFKASLENEVINKITLSLIQPALAAAGEILGNRTQAEDAVQETFVRLIRHRDRYDDSKPFLPWFYTILRNVCRDMHRQEGRRRKFLETLRQQARPEVFESHSMDSADLLSMLSSSEQEVLRLRILHDFRFREIAAVIGISESAAKKRAQRGLRRLRKYMKSRVHNSANVNYLTGTA